MASAATAGGVSVGLSLNYNSQNWRQDPAGIWNYGRDIGYGYGFRLLAGSMQLFDNSQWAFDHWTFTDSTGAEYRLDTQVNWDGTPAPNTGVWRSSTDSTPILYEPAPTACISPVAYSGNSIAPPAATKATRECATRPWCKTPMAIRFCSATSRA